MMNRKISQERTEGRLKSLEKRIDTLNVTDQEKRTMRKDLKELSAEEFEKRYSKFKLGSISKTSF